MRAACEQRALLFSDEVFETKLRATLERAAAAKFPRARASLKRPVDLAHA
jgi:hypothetical protein